MSHLDATQAALSRPSALTLAGISVALAAIAAVWLATGSVHAEVIALAAATVAAVSGHVARMSAARRAAAVIEWGLLGCGMLTEFGVYAGIGVAVDLHPGVQLGLAGSSLDGTFVAGFGGVGTAGIWHLAILTVIFTMLAATTDICAHGPGRPGTRLWLLGPPGDLKAAVASLVMLVFGARAAFLVVLVLGVAVLGATITEGARRAGDRGSPRAYRGDGRIAVWIGKWVDGKVPPLPPLMVGLLVTGVLTALGLHNLSGILLLSPAEAMLLAAFASWHPHDGRGDWLVPPLIQAAEYVFLAEAGYAGHVWPPLTFALAAAAGFRHLDLAHRVRGNLADGIDRRGFGWEGRMLIAGIAAAIGIAQVVYVALALYLWWRAGRDWMIGWAARQPAANP